MYFLVDQTPQGNIPPEGVAELKNAINRAESRRERKTAIIAVVIVLALIIIGGVLFFLLLPPPLEEPCVNGLLDEGEEGIDCGGICATACEKPPEPPPEFVDSAYRLPASISDIALDLANDRIYVLDEIRHRILVYDSQFNHIGNFGEERVKTAEGWSYFSGGLDDERLLFPASIYLANDKLYVLDRVPRIQVFSNELVLEQTLDFSNQAVEALPKVPDTPNTDGGRAYILVSNSGEITISEEVSNAVASFDSSFGFNSVTTTGTSAGEVNIPRQIAFGPQGNIYLADSGNSRIQVLNKELGFVKTISENLVLPVGVAVADSGEIYVLDSGDSMLKAFDSAGNFVKQTGGLGKGEGQFYNPIVVKLDSEGMIYVVEQGNSRIQVFDKNLKFVEMIEGLERTFNLSFTPFYPAIAPNGDIAFSDVLNHKVFVFDKDYELKKVLGGRGFGNNQLNAPKGLAFDSTGKLFISDSGNRRIQIFSSDYTYQSTITHKELIWPLSISVSEEAKVFVVDDKHKKVLVFNQSGMLLDEIGKAEGITLPLGVLAQDGKIYITDDKLQTIEILDSSFNNIESVGGIDDALGFDVEFNESLGIDSKNRLLFADNRNRVVIAYDLTLKTFSTFGGFGNALQELSILEVATRGGVTAVADMESHRVKIFDANEKEIGELTIADLA